MLEELLKAEKITIDDVQTYQTFQLSEAGAAWYQKKMMETFLEQPPYEQIGGEIISFIDGRRSMLREIYYSLKHINQLIKDYQNDNQPRSEQQ